MGARAYDVFSVSGRPLRAAYSFSSRSAGAPRPDRPRRTGAALDNFLVFVIDFDKEHEEAAWASF